MPGELVKVKGGYFCCDVVVDLDDPEVIEKVAAHIHYHRLGTSATARECRQCREFAEKKISAIREADNARPD